MKDKPSHRRERRSAAHGTGQIGAEAGDRVDFMKRFCSLTNSSTLLFLRFVRNEALAD